MKFYKIKLGLFTFTAMYLVPMVIIHLISGAFVTKGIFIGLPSAKVERVFGTYPKYHAFIYGILHFRLIPIFGFISFWLILPFSLWSLKRGQNYIWALLALILGFASSYPFYWLVWVKIVNRFQLVQWSIIASTLYFTLSYCLISCLTKFVLDRFYDVRKNSIA